MYFAFHSFSLSLFFFFFFDHYSSFLSLNSLLFVLFIQLLESSFYCLDVGLNIPFVVTDLISDSVWCVISCVQTVCFPTIGRVNQCAYIWLLFMWVFYHYKRLKWTVLIIFLIWFELTLFQDVKVSVSSEDSSLYGIKMMLIVSEENLELKPCSVVKK